VALKGDDGREHSVCIDWHREEGQIQAIERFKERTVRVVSENCIVVALS
jgi:hypothetical protein